MATETRTPEQDQVAPPLSAEELANFLANAGAGDLIDCQQLFPEWADLIRGQAAENTRLKAALEEVGKAPDGLSDVELHALVVVAQAKIEAMRVENLVRERDDYAPAWDESMFWGLPEVAVIEKELIRRKVVPE